MTPRARTALTTAGLLLAVLGAGLLYAFDPSGPGSLFPPCPLFALTGLLCPGCGTTRALHALVHADLARAMAMNPLMVVSIPAVALMGWDALGFRLAPLNLWARALARPAPWGAVLVVYGVLRNLPWPPFAWLAPG